MAYGPIMRSQPTGLNKPCPTLELELEMCLRGRSRSGEIQGQRIVTRLTEREMLTITRSVSDSQFCRKT